ncbi:MAG: MFS transporter [Anaerolineaceae bacterium]|nr:MFS transporter [Anaerolineaceae bacterium]
MIADIAQAKPSLRTFYILVLTQTLSLIGSRMTSIAIGIRVSIDTGQAAPLLLVAFFNELPPMLFGSAAGVLVDRWNRRGVMMISDAGQAVGSLLLLASFLSGEFQLWHLYVIVFLQGTFAMFQAPAEDAVTSVLVDDAHRDRANALKQMAFPLAGVIAPAVTGLIYPLVGIAGVVLVDMVTFLIAVAVVFQMDIPQPPPSEEGKAASGGFWRELRGGLAFLSARRPLLGLMIYFTVLNFLLNGPLDLGIPYLIKVTGSESVTGLLLAAMNAGALVGGAAIALRRKTWKRVNVFMPTFLLTGAMFIVYGTSRTPIPLAISMFFLFFTLPLGWGLFTALLQVKTPPDMQGRVFSLFGQLGFVASTTSFLSVGPLVDRILEPAVEPGWIFAPIVGDQPGAGMGLVLVVVGGVILIMTIVTYIVPSIRRIETDLPDYQV